MKTYGDFEASRRSLRSARLSRADIGCTLASPLLALRTCKRPVVRSMSRLRGPQTMAVSDQDSRGDIVRQVDQDFKAWRNAKPPTAIGAAQNVGAAVAAISKRIGGRG